jgi:tetratricopeptide (TPR) repeat protein
VEIQEGAEFCANCGEPAAEAAEAMAEAATPGDPIPAEAPGEDVEELVRRAVQADLRGNPEAALALAEDAVSADPAHARARSLLAGLYERLGRNDDAITQYEAALSLDPDNQLDRLRLKRLAPERAEALSTAQMAPVDTAPADAPVPQTSFSTSGEDFLGVPARKTGSSRRGLLIAAAAIVAASVVVGIGLIGWKFILQPRMAQPDPSTEVAAAMDDTADRMVARARGAILQGDYERARSLANQALAADPQHEDALALLAELPAPTAEAPGGDTGDLADAVFPGEPASAAAGAVLGLQAGYEAGAGVPVAPILAELPSASEAPPITSTGPQGAVVTTNPSHPQGTGSLSELPAIDGSGSTGGISAPAPQGSNMGALMGNVSGGMTNSAPSGLPAGLSRTPGSMRPGSAGTQQNTHQGPVVPRAQPGTTMNPSVSGGAAQPGPSTVRPAEAGTSGQPAGSVRAAQPSGDGSTMSVNPAGGTVRSAPRGGSAPAGGNAADEAWQLQRQGMTLAQQGNTAGAIRALQAADAKWAESNAPSASTARQNIQRQLNLLEGQ